MLARGQQRTLSKDASGNDDVVVENAWRSRLRRRLLRVTLPAVRQLARAAAGERVFENDHHLRACIALVRLTPVLVAPAPSPSPQPAGARGRQPVEVNPLHPDHRGNEAEIIRRMNELREQALAAKAAGRLDDRRIIDQPKLDDDDDNF